MIHLQNMIIMSGGDLAVPLGLVVFYRFKGLSDEQARKRVENGSTSRIASGRRMSSFWVSMTMRTAVTTTGSW